MSGFFNRAALAALGGVATLGVVLAVVEPPAAKTSAPDAVLWQPKPGGIQKLKLDVTLPAREKVEPLSSAKALHDRFGRMGYTWDVAGAPPALVPPVFLASLPEDLDEMKVVQEKKSVFFRTILPLVLQVNRELRADRARLFELRSQTRLNEDLAADDQLWLAAMAETYKTKRGDIDSLLAKVDEIPPSLALAQAAEESGWGTSRFARQGNAIFGQWTTSSSAGIKPKDREPGKTHYVRAFDNLMDSVRSYILNLNTHRAYRGLRAERLALRRVGAPVDGFKLAGHLLAYSERGEDYVKSIRAMIRRNGLRKLDGAQLAVPEDPAA